MKKALILGVMLLAAALVYRYLRGVGERTGSEVGGAPKRTLDNVREATQRIERQEAKQLEESERKSEQ